jgi:hypothetical protein
LGLVDEFGKGMNCAELDRARTSIKQTAGRDDFILKVLIFRLLFSQVHDQTSARGALDIRYVRLVQDSFLYSNLQIAMTRLPAKAKVSGRKEIDENSASGFLAPASAI